MGLRLSAEISRTTRVGVREVAERAGVSTATVSRVLSKHPNVSPATHDRVITAVQELGYQPNALGQMLRRGATRIVGFSIGDISNPLFAQIALGAEATLAQHGYSLVLSNSHGELNRELANLEMLETAESTAFFCRSPPKPTSASWRSWPGSTAHWWRSIAT